jgi:hypothetical protein
VISLMQRMGFFLEMLKTGAFTRSALTVAFVLLYHHLNADTGRCDPSIATLAKETGLTTRSVKSAIDELKRSGWWRINREGMPGRGGRTNAYSPKLNVMKQGSLHGIGSNEAHDTSSELKAVKRATPVRAKSGEAQRQKVVKRTSPKPVKNQESLDLPLFVRSAKVRACVNPAFENFWSVYPSRHPHSNPKKPALEKFAMALKRGIDPAVIIRGAENYRAAIERNRTDARYIAQAQTWLNQERWNDHQEAPEPPRLRVGMN